MEKQSIDNTQELVDKLVESDFQYIMQTDNGLELLRDYLENGFSGYSNFSEAELLEEVKQREEMGQL